MKHPIWRSRAGWLLAIIPLSACASSGVHHSPESPVQSQQTESPEAIAESTIGSLALPPDSPERRQLAAAIAAILREPGDVAAHKTLRDVALATDYSAWSFHLRRHARTDKGQDGKTNVIIDSGTAEGPPEVAAAWLVYALALAAGPTDGAAPEPASSGAEASAFDRELFALETMAKILADLKSKPEADKVKLDPTLDILLRLHAEGLVDAYLYLGEFRPEYSASYSAWRSGHGEKIKKYFLEYVLYPRVHVPAYVLALSGDPADIFHGSGATAATVGTLHPQEAEDPAKIAALEKEADDLRQALTEVADQDSGRATRMRIALALSDLRLKRVHAAIPELEQGLAGLARSEPERVEALRLILSTAYRRDGRFEAAVKAAQQVYANTADQDLKDGAISELGTIYRFYFKILSWDAETGVMTDDNPADFVNNDSVGEGVDKYGLKNDEEDIATFGTFFIMQWSIHKGEVGPLCLHVRREMAAGNFIPALKYLYFKYVAPSYLSIGDQKEVLIRMGSEGQMVKGQTFLKVYKKALQGDTAAFVKLLGSFGLPIDEPPAEREKVRTALAQDLTMEEVTTRIGKATATGAYIPDTVREALELYRSAAEFAARHGLDS